MKRSDYSKYTVSAKDAEALRFTKKEYKARLTNLEETYPSLSRKDKVSNTKEQNRLKEELESIGKTLLNAPPEARSEQEVVTELVLEFEQVIEKANKKLANIDEVFSKNRLHTIEWDTKEIVLYEYLLRNYKYLLKSLKESNFEEFVDFLERLYSDSVSEIVRSAGYGAAHSTSKVSNFIEDCKKEVNANFWGSSFGGGKTLLYKVYYLEMQVKASKELK